MEVHEMNPTFLRGHAIIVFNKLFAHCTTSMESQISSVRNEVLEIVDTLQSRLAEVERERDQYRRVLKLTLGALRDVIRQIPNNDGLADWRLDFAETAELEATQILKQQQSENNGDE